MAVPPESGLNLVRFAGEFEEFSAGQSVFEAGDAGADMFIVKEGQVEVVIRNRVVETVGPGGFVGEMALIDKNPRSASAIAKTACKLVRVNEERFKFLVQQTPFFALEVMRVMAARLRQMDAASG